MNTIKSLYSKYKSVVFALGMVVALTVLSTTITVVLIEVSNITGFSPMGLIAVVLIDAAILGYAASVFFDVRDIKQDEELAK